MALKTTNPTPAERIGLGIGCAVAGLFGMSVMDALAKLLGEGYAISQVIFGRNAVGFIAILVFLTIRGTGFAFLRPRRLDLLLARTALSLGAGFSFFTSLRYLPLADAFAIAFAAPLFITALSVPLLGERVGITRWTAVIIGFFGVLVVVQPGSGSFRVEALLPLAAAFFHAIGMLLGRRMTREMTTSAIMFWPSLGATIVTLGLMPYQWETPNSPDLWLFITMGLVGTLGMALITQGYRHAPAAVIAPFDYSTLLWATIFGWVFWHDVPGPNVWIGALILTASGLYLLYRETKSHA